MKEQDKYRADVYKNIGCGFVVGSLIPLLVNAFSLTLLSVLKLLYGIAIGILSIKKGLDIVLATENSSTYTTKRRKK